MTAHSTAIREHCGHQPHVQVWRNCGHNQYHGYNGNRVCSSAECAVNQYETSACANGNGSNRQCASWDGQCSNGTPFASASGREHGHCGACNSGYWLNGRRCSAWRDCGHNQYQSTGANQQPQPRLQHVPARMWRYQ